MHATPPGETHARGTEVDRPADAFIAAVEKRLDDLVDEASMGSFPASDPPAYWARSAEDVGTNP